MEKLQDMPSVCRCRRTAGRGAADAPAAERAEEPAQGGPGRAEEPAQRGPGRAEEPAQGGPGRAEEPAQGGRPGPRAELKLSRGKDDRAV